mgnify:CR=1 FL=1
MVHDFIATSLELTKQTVKEANFALTDVDEVVLVDVKSGKAKIYNHEKNLKETIEKKKVRWEEYRVPDGVTKGKRKTN